MAVRLPQLGPRMRIVVKYVGLVFLALITFVFAVQATFPYHRVKEKLEVLASSKFDVQIREIDRGIIPGRFYLKDVTLRTRPSASDLDRINALPDQKDRDTQLAQLVSTIYIERLEVDLGLLGLIRGTASVNLDAKFGAGSIAGNIAVSKSGTSVHIVGNDVPSQTLPMREVLSNLPMSGIITFEVELDLPNEKLKTGKVGPNWEVATGTAELACPAGCTIGDGKSKLKLKAKNSRSQAFAGEGTDFGKVNIDTLLARIEMKDGKVDITKFEAKSPDVELNVDYTMTLQPELNESVVLGCIRFKGSEALKKREPRTFDQILLTGAARAPDGLDHIRLKGTFKDMKKLPEVCGPGISAVNIDSPGSTGAPSRPALRVQPPDEPVNPGSAVAIPPPTPTPPALPDAAVGGTDAAVAVPLPHPEHENTGSGSAEGPQHEFAPQGGAAESPR